MVKEYIAKESPRELAEGRELRSRDSQEGAFLYLADLDLPYSFSLRLSHHTRVDHR